MKNQVKKLTPAVLLLTLFAGAFSLSQVAHANTQNITINGNGTDDSLTREQAREQKEQWDATRSLRNKVNHRVEKEFDKAANSIDSREACEKSLNVNAYWEPNTLRCLDRTTGRPVSP